MVDPLGGAQITIIFIIAALGPCFWHHLEMLQLSVLRSSAEGWDSLICRMQAIVQTQRDASNSARIEAMETHARLTAVELQLNGLSCCLGSTSPQGSEGAVDGSVELS
ncbi:hypothetical protein FOMPIDRAFT_91574 [Fomitopsis schrenkii]|uniref:Uncharacterized protein n=1 Tax=Fomitopsis schrenkii TaxID=2126942 RepID=S8FG18_FOMSC|nr:hypothetical protein FOMPIDRAFT_91574 [Fomitopsis schrenkii]